MSIVRHVFSERVQLRKEWRRDEGENKNIGSRFSSFSCFRSWSDRSVTGNGPDLIVDRVNSIESSFTGTPPAFVVVRRGVQGA